MTIEPIGDIGDVTLAEVVQQADFSVAQMLARRDFPARAIEREAQVTESTAQNYERRQRPRLY